MIEKNIWAIGFKLCLLLTIIGILLSISIESFLWSTAFVTILFIILIFGIDPLSPRKKVEE